MKRFLDLLLIASFVVLCLLPSAQMLWPLVEEKVLTGALQEKPRPTLTLAGLGSEAYQRGFTAYYEQHYGFRASLARLDNSILYYAFHESRPEKQIRVGRGDILYISEQIDFWNDRRVQDLGRPARRIKAAQDALHRNGIELVFVINPTKPLVWPTDLPPAWNDPTLPSPRPSEVLRASLPLELARAGVRFVDGWKVLEGLARREPEAVYTRTGRHLTSPAACMLTEEALRVAPLPGKHVPAFDCSYVMSADMSILEEEYDLWRLLNIIAPRPSAKMPAVRQDLPSTTPESDLPATLVVGSSFGWKITSELARNHATSQLAFHYYGSLLFTWPKIAKESLELGSPEWRAMMRTKQLVLYVIPEEYLPDDGPFFAECIKAFGEPTGENVALTR